MPEVSYRVTFAGTDCLGLGELASVIGNARLNAQRSFTFQVSELRTNNGNGLSITTVPVLEQLVVVHLVDGRPLASEIDAQDVCVGWPKARVIVAVDAEGGRRVVKNNTGTEVVFDTAEVK